MKKVCISILMTVLLIGLAGCGDARDKLTCLEDITDEMIVSGELGYGKYRWTESQINGSYQTSWEKMTGTDTCMTMSYLTETEITLTYTVTDAGEGFRLALVLPDETVTTLLEGENTLILPAGETKVVLAAYKTGGAFSLEII